MHDELHYSQKEVFQCNGMDISWDHLRELYMKNRSQGDEIEGPYIIRTFYFSVYRVNGAGGCKTTWPKRLSAMIVLTIGSF